MLGPGHEPYRQIGVAVNETQILDVAARAKVVKAQDLYSKMYREVGCMHIARELHRPCAAVACAV